MLKKTLAQFIPIIVIFILLTSFRKLVEFSNTVIGKLFAVLIIIFYTYLDKILGVFVCAIVIFYYQMDVVENMLNMDILENMDQIDPNYTTEFVGEEAQREILDDYVFLSKKEKKEDNITESMVNYTNVDDNKDILINNENMQEEFRKQNCSNNRLMNKEVQINYEMTEHIFPEIKFRRGVCNPCNKSCDFSVIENKINTEKELRGI
jgi:hypothetical protein